MLMKPLSPSLKVGREETSGKDAFDEVELVDVEENVDEEDGSWYGILSTAFAFCFCILFSCLLG